MAVNARDVQALTYLAKRVREDTYGAGQWDEAGIAAKIAELVGQDLTLTVERVVRHAADKEARTPGAILRPFTPPPAVGTPQHEPHDAHGVCVTCSCTEADCRRLWADDHEYLSIAAARARKAKPYDPEVVRAVKIDASCEESRPPPPERPHKHSPHVEQLREAMTHDQPSEHVDAPVAAGVEGE